MINLQLQYGVDLLRRLAEDIGFAPSKWSRVAIATYRKRIQLILCAQDVHDLHALKVVHVASGNDDGPSTLMPVSDQIVLNLDFHSNGNSTTAVIGIERCP